MLAVIPSQLTQPLSPLSATPQPLGRRFAAWLQGLFGRMRPGQAAPVPAQLPAAERPPTAPSTGPALQRKRHPFAAQAEQVEVLRRLAHTDGDTGLPNRRYFVGRLRSTLADAGAPGAALLIVRVLQLDALKQRLGDEAVGRSLSVIADVLAAYQQHVPGAFAGRLNESDFGLCLPVQGVADETAATLLRALRATPAASAGAAELALGGVDALHAESASEALAAADEALAQAEAAGPFCIEIHVAGASGEAPLGERAWRVRIDEALHEGRASLGEFAVLDCDGRLIQLECPLRVQLEVGGPFREAKRWLAMASRSRLLPRVDLAALDLALIAIARDGRPRGVHVSAASLATAGFVGEVQRRLEAAPEASARLWIEVAEGVSLDRALPRLREAGAAWRRHGVHLGVEHAGGSMQGLARLSGAGLDHVKIEARFVRGADTEPVVSDFARGLVQLSHGLGLKIIAEGIDDSRDLSALWALGFDGATGPAVRLAEVQAEPEAEAVS